jgi:dTMP kinase
LAADVAGHFITFEGGEGTGKSTHIRRLAERLKSQTRELLVTREPGGTPEAEAVRGLLVSGEASRWTPTAEALLNYAARETHLTQAIRPALERGAIVLCDRFMDSTRVYQGYAGNCAISFIDALEDAIVGATRPQLTLVFDLDTELGLARAKGRKGDAAEDRYERKGVSFHQRVRHGFLAVAEQDPKRCRVVDAARDVEAVSNEVWAFVNEALRHG